MDNKKPLSKAVTLRVTALCYLSAPDQSHAHHTHYNNLHFEIGNTHHVTYLKKPYLTNHFRLFTDNWPINKPLKSNHGKA